ncbi:MAG: amylosucrase [Candidatus Sumerlaeaceae bacterium]
MPNSQPHHSSSEAAVTNASEVLTRQLPRLKSSFTSANHFAHFEQRLQGEWPRLFDLLLFLYGSRSDFEHQLEQLLLETAAAFQARPAELHELDLQRERTPDWFQSNQMVGAIAYVDLFAGDLAGLRARLPYLKELGITYLHLMPLFRSPEGNSDGGYAVSSYRDVDPRLGTMDEFAALSHEFRNAGISLCLDFVFNHTSDQHLWAERAKSGNVEFREFYLTFPDRTEPDAYEQTLREIFPSTRRGSFTWNETMHRWVWTTFHSFQWDLNYDNPAVFRAMAAEMLFLANQGVEILRLDAVAFIWKRLGTTCENQPEAHMIIQAMNAIVRIAAPALLFKSEAIVHPDEVLKYVSPGECQLSYNPLLMALLWETLATREVRLLEHSLATRYALPSGTSWVNYVRCHDDIGWTFADDDARRVGIDPHGHRQFLNAFYTGRFSGSFARGVPFQENPVTGDARVSGTLASLAGLEEALKDSGKHQQTLTELALARILLLHGLIFAAGGIPLIYLGDEIGQLNDYSYEANPEKAEDSRWVHRPAFHWGTAERRAADLPQRFFTGIQRLLRTRKALPALSGSTLRTIHTGNPHVLTFSREHQAEPIVVIANMTETSHQLHPDILRGIGSHCTDRITGTPYDADQPLNLSSYQLLWLSAAPSKLRES